MLFGHGAGEGVAVDWFLGSGESGVLEEEVAMDEPRLVL